MRYRCGVPIVVLLLLISNSLLLLPLTDWSIIGTVEAAQPPMVEDTVTYWDGDWTVDTNVTYRNQTIILNGNLTVSAFSSLTLINVTLKLNGTGNLSKYILVNHTASLHIRDYDRDPKTLDDCSVITSNHTDGLHRFGFFVRSKTQFSFINSKLSECGRPGGLSSEWGLAIRTNKALIKNSNISRCYAGLTVSSCSGVKIENNTFSKIHNYGIYSTTTKNMVIHNNTISMREINSDGLWLTSAVGTSIYGNTIVCSRSLSCCIFLSTTCKWIDIISNIINCSAANSRGIYCQADHVNISSNQIGCRDSNYCVDLESVQWVNLTDNQLQGKSMISVLDIGGSENITVHGSTISGLSCRTVKIDNSACNITFNSVTVTASGTQEAIGFIGVKDVLLINSTFSGTSKDMCLYSGSQVVARNCRWSNDQLFDDISTLTKQYYLDIKVVDISGAPIENANVSITDLSAVEVFNGSTDICGQVIDVVLTKGVHNKTQTILQTPHNVTVTKSGYGPWYAEPTMDKSKTLYVMLLKPGEKPTIHINNDWDVNDTEEYWNETFIVDGNITVDSGETLIFHNCTIMMNCTRMDGQYHIEVRTGGTLQIFDYDDNYITTGDATVITDSPYDVDNASSLDFAYNFSVDWDGMLEVRNSSIRECGWESVNDWEQGVCVYTDYFIFDHVDISNRFKGLIINGGSGGAVSNCSVTINATSLGAVGIQSWDRQGLRVDENTILMTGGAGHQVAITLDNNTGTMVSNNNITLSSTVGWADGIGIIGGTGNYVSKNQVAQNIHGTSIILWSTNSATILANYVIVNTNWSTAILNYASLNSVLMDNIILQNEMGVGISVQEDGSGTVLHNNTIFGFTDVAYAFYIQNATNNFQLSNNTVNLTGMNSQGLHTSGSSNFGIYGMKITIHDQNSVGMSFVNSDNATVIGAEIMVTASATGAHAVWLQGSCDIFMVNLDITMYNDFGSGIETVNGANNSYIASSTIFTTSATTQAVVGNNCTGIFYINTTLNAQGTNDVRAVNDARLILLNSTFNDKHIQGNSTQVTVGWFLNIHIRDGTGQPVSGANVLINEADQTELVTTQTGPTGMIGWLPMLGYIEDENTMNNGSNPYWINVSNATCWESVLIDMTHGSQTLIIDLINEDPVIVNPKSAINIIEDSVTILDFNATDHEYNPITWSVNTSLEWVTLDPNTGKLTVAPNEPHVGKYYLRITATDVNSGVDSFELTLNIINRPPILTTANPFFVDEDAIYNVDLDSDDDPYTTWNLVSGPSWLNLNENTGVLSGQPNNGHVGEWSVAISISDSHDGITWNNFTLTVNNTLPEISTETLPDALEDKLYQYTLTSTEGSAGDIDWKLISGPKWLKIDPLTGILSGTPLNNHIGTRSVTIEVHDGNGARMQKEFQMIINNTPPTILTDAVIWAEEDLLYSVEYSSSDDGQGNMIWVLATDAGGWLSIDEDFGTLSGVPRNAHVGKYWVNVTVTDNHGDSSSQNFTLIVNNTNDIPVISTKNVLTATEDKPYKVDYDAKDDDGDTLIWSINTKAVWLDMDSSTGILSGTPLNRDVGVWQVDVICDDGNSGIVTRSFNITVINVNDVPVIDHYLPSEEFPVVEEGMELKFNVSYSDEDSETLTIVWTLDGSEVRSDVPFWTYQPAFETAGDHEVVINITDTGGASVQQRWIVIVSTANRLPVINDYTPVSLKPILEATSSELIFTVNISDPDYDHMEYAWSINGEDIGERTEKFIMERDRYDTGTYVVRMTVTDDKGGSVDLTWNVEVEPKAKDKDGSESDDLTIYILIAIVVAVLLVILVFLFVIKKKGSQIEDIFIISNTGILLAHKTKELRPDMDDEILSGMLTAIQDFVKDAFKDKSKFGLRRLDFGDSVIHLKRGKGFYIALVLSGAEPKNLEQRLDKTIGCIEEKYGKVLESWKGNLGKVRGIKDELDLLIK